MEALGLDIEFDNGPHARARERMCVVTREVRPVAELIRFVIGPDGAAVPDLKQKLPGRGVWVTATQTALGDAIRRRAFARGFRREVRLADDLLILTERLLKQAALDALAMAAKSGLVVSGFARAEAVLRNGEAVALLQAQDGSPEGLKKLEAVLRRSGLSPISIIGSLTSAELDLALGRPNVVHAALLAGRASDVFLARLRRLERFRADDQADRPAQARPEPLVCGH
jgi:uncharacterized protein